MYIVGQLKGGNMVFFIMKSRQERLSHVDIRILIYFFYFNLL